MMHKDWHKDAQQQDARLNDAKNLHIPLGLHERL